MQGSVPLEERSRAFVGCSGWQYSHWRRRFYPEALPQNRWLEHYASQFDTVEVNNSFYRLPEASTFAGWKARVPSGFVFAVKASRFLTHMKKLKDPEEPVDRLIRRARALGRTLGPVLYQLPTRWRVDVERLAVFLRALPRGRHHAIEFRDPSWYTDEVFGLLAHHRVALCLHDMAGSTTERIQLGPFVYVRFHGPEKYRGRYRQTVIDDWGRWLAAQLRGGRSVYAYFNNDVNAQAPRDALRLRNAITNAM